MIGKTLNFPLDFTFKITTLASDFTISDSNGNQIAYVRQKMFKLKEDVIVFSDESRSKEIFRIKADRWLDFNASYAIKNSANDENIGRLARHGMRSFWKARYDIWGENQKNPFQIHEDNAWVKILDSMVGELPIVGFFTGYFLNPTYNVTNSAGTTYFKLKKMPSFFGRKFQLSKLQNTLPEEELLIVLSLFMMVLLERMRG